VLAQDFLILILYGEGSRLQERKRQADTAVQDYALDIPTRSSNPTGSGSILDWADPLAIKVGQGTIQAALLTTIGRSCTDVPDPNPVAYRSQVTIANLRDRHNQVR
jgi:hypothetical protein